MKKAVISGLIIISVFSLASCTKTEENVVEDSSGQSEVIETEFVEESEQLAERENIEKSEEEIPETENTEISKDELIPEASEVVDTYNGIRFTRKIYDSYSNPDGTERNYIYHYEVPTIEIEGNETVQKKIQADLDEIMNQFFISTDEMFSDESVEADEQDVYMDFFVERMDENVISIGWYEEAYGQWAHGWHRENYLNYFTKSGEKVTFEKLGKGFREKAMELVKEKADEMQQDNKRFFDNYEQYVPLVVCDGTENKSDVHKEVYGNDHQEEDDEKMQTTFFITEDGFSFISNEYVMQPYVEGIITFEIPREAFGDALTADIFR